MTSGPSEQEQSRCEDEGMDAVPASLPPEAAADLPRVDPVDLPDDALIVDVRDAADYRAGHAPGALSIPVGQLASRLDEVRALAASLGKPLAVSCGGGTKQLRATAYLRENGVDAAVLRGGMRGWKSGGRPVVTD